MKVTRGSGRLTDFISLADKQMDEAHKDDLKWNSVKKKTNKDEKWTKRSTMKNMKFKRSSYFIMLVKKLQ